MSELIDKRRDGAVQIVRMNRPDKKNALTAAMYQALADALDETASDPALRVTLLLGVPGAFTAGNDIGDFLKVAMSGSRDSNAVFNFLERLIVAKKPVVAGVDGLAIGVGVTLLMHCDHVVASSRSTFKTPFVDLGLLPEAGSSLIAPRIMGHHRAFAMLAMGETFTAEAAREAGLVNKLVADGDLDQAALAAAAVIAAKPAEAMAISRDLIRGNRADILARMKEEAVLWEARLKSDEARQAFMAFMARK
jgi:enoyl-CoA hydratase/carnithine racemase